MRKVSIILCFMIVVAGFSATIFYVSETNEAENEADKRYVEVAEPIAVENIVRQEKNTAITNSKFSFEKLLSEEEEDYDREFRIGMSEVRNHDAARTVQIYDCDLEVLTRLNEIFKDSYTKGEMPDLSEIYNLENQERQENMLLLQAWIYQECVSNRDVSITCSHDLEIKNVEIIEENLRKVTFQIVQDIEENHHTYSKGNWFAAYLLDTDEGSRIIQAWVDGIVFHMTKERVGDIIQREGTNEVEEIVKKEIFDDYIESKNSMLRAEPLNDDITDMEVTLADPTGHQPFLMLK